MGVVDFFDEEYDVIVISTFMLGPIVRSLFAPANSQR